MKIKFSDDSSLSISYANLDNDDKHVLYIGVDSEDGYDKVQKIFTDETLTKTMCVLSDDDVVCATYENFTTVRSMSCEFNTQTKRTEVQITMTYSGLQSEVDELKSEIEFLNKNICLMGEVVENLTKQNTMLTECLLEMSEVVYGETL